MYKKAYKFLLNTYKEEYIKKTIITFINLFKSNNYKLAYFKKILSRIKLTIRYKEYKKNKYFLLLIINIYLSYQKELEDNNLLDFNDMINKSINSLKVQGVKRKYKYIIIDEYQDTSLLKVKMIQSTSYDNILKRAKQMFHNGVKGIKTLKDIWNTVITKPGTAILNAVLPETKPLTDILYTVDNYVNKGFDWVINKTDNSTKKQIDTKRFYDYRPVKPVINVGPGGDRTYLNFNK